MEMEDIKGKLQTVPAQVFVQDQLCCGDGARIDHETPLYTAINSAFYSIVNACARRLDYPLIYCQSHGNIPSAVVLLLL